MENAVDLIVTHNIPIENTSMPIHTTVTEIKITPYVASDSEMEQFRKNQQLADWNNELLRFKNKLVHYARNAYDKTVGKIDSVKHDLLCLEAEKTELDLIINTKNANKTQHRITANIKEMSEMLYSYYTNIWLDNYGNLWGTTKPIKAVYADTEYNFGAFNVCVNWRQEPKISASEGNRLSDNEKYPHPHIADYNVCCFGDFINPIMKLVKEEKYFDVLLMCHQYLCTINPESAYINPINWLSEDIAKTICGNCLEKKENCACDICEYCDHQRDDCSCDRCPSSGDRLDGFPDADYCEGCRYYKLEDEDDPDSYYICTC